jgi:hypothetical protein
MSIDSAQIRHRNFMATFQGFKDANPGLPERGMLKLFAQQIGFSDRYLSHIKCNRKNIGTNVARMMEHALALPHGWMDREHGDVTQLAEDADDAEKIFIQTAVTLYRANPEAARNALMELLRVQLNGTVP